MPKYGTVSQVLLQLIVAMIKPYDTALRSAMLLHLEILATKAISAIRGIACAVSTLTWLNKLN